MVDAGSQLFFRLNENPRPALSGFAHWKMPISGLDLIFRGRCQLAPTRWKCPESPGSTTTADSEIQGVGEGVDPPPDPGSMAAPPPLLGPHPLAHPFFLMSKKEVFLASWVLGKFKVKTLPTRGRTHGSFLCQGCGWEH